MWAFALLLRRIEDARDLMSTYAQVTYLAVHGRELLAEHVPPALTMASYPRGVDDDWCELADLAYATGRARWLSGGDDGQVLAAALHSQWRSIHSSASRAESAQVLTVLSGQIVDAACEQLRLAEHERTPTVVS